MGAREPAKSRMVAACPRCRARYRVLAERLPSQGARLRCALCRAGFRVRLPPVVSVARRAAPRSAAAALPPPDLQASAPLQGLALPQRLPDAEQPRSPGDGEVAEGPEAARRLARIVASELLLYHPERFDAGIQAGDVLAAMAPEIEEGRVLLAQRMSAEGDASPLLEQEILRVAAERASKPSD